MKNAYEIADSRSLRYESNHIPPQADQSAMTGKSPQAV
jgi:hypothetical protein